MQKSRRRILVEACDICENQVVICDGQERQVESVEVEDGKTLSVKIKFLEVDSVHCFTEGDHLTVLLDNEPFVTLEDHYDEANKGVKIFVEGGSRFLYIRPEGYGEATAEDGDGSPIALEYYNGRLRLIVFNNINEHDPQIIDLEDAKESNRQR